MPLNTQHGPADEAPLLDGDDRFTRVVMRGHPALLLPGVVSAAVNCRFREGITEPRGGSVKPAWLNQISGTDVRAWDSVQAVGQYVDPQRRVWTLLAVNGGVRAILPHNPPRLVPVPAGVTLTGGEQFIQFGAAVLLLRGAGGDTLQMTELGTGFVAVPEPVVPGMNAIPRARRGAVAADRLWLVTLTDQIWASDILDHTTYHPLNQKGVGDGAQEVVTITPFGQTSLIVFLKGSVYRLTDILNPDVQGLLSNTTAPRVTARYGCLAADSVVDVGTDLVWLCGEGVASLTLTVLGEIQTGAGPTRPPMFSDDIQPLIKRIRWDYASGAQGVFWDGRLYMAVPLDEAEALGNELASGSYPAAGPVTVDIPVTAGVTYQYTPGVNEVSLTNGVATITTAQTFVAAGSSVTITGAANGLTVTASVKRRYVGFNNAILVYDFKALEPGWQGYDEAADILLPRYWFRRDYNGRERLFFITEQGWANLYEEGYEDASGTPYVDLVLSGPLSEFALSFTVNGGAPIVADFARDFNFAGQWGTLAAPAGNPAANLWADDDGVGFADGTFAAPNTAPVKITNGVRFYSTNGSIPTIVFTMDPFDEEVLTATATLWTWIQQELLSRGYTTPVKLERKSARKLQALVETWDPTYSLALKSEGISEETEFVSDQTRSRVVYHRPFHRAPWDRTNVNNDFAEPWRQDYSLNLAVPFQLGDGLGIGLHQEAEHTVRTNGRARAHQVRVTNARGRLRLLGLGYEGRRRERGDGIKI